MGPALTASNRAGQDGPAALLTKKHKPAHDAQKLLQPARGGLCSAQHGLGRGGRPRLLESVVGLNAHHVEEDEPVLELGAAQPRKLSRHHAGRGPT